MRLRPAIALPAIAAVTVIWAAASVLAEGVASGRQRPDSEDGTKAEAQPESAGQREARAKAEAEFKRQEVELEYWRSIKDAKQPGQLRDYLQRYPNGSFASIARRWLEESEASAAKPVPPSLPIEAAPPPRAAGFGGTLIEMLAVGRWATGSWSNCGVARKTYSLRVDGNNVVWRDEAGNVDVEIVTASSASSFNTVTVRSSHVDSANVPVGRGWRYLLLGPGQVMVTPGGGNPFKLFKC